ncbi:MAG: hypothetical protein KY397_04295 [Gemmatimonadetes bacterium]|nr:hypothetical protein [Gemmatimonadota bacterium]
MARLPLASLRWIAGPALAVLMTGCASTSPTVESSEAAPLRGIDFRGERIEGSATDPVRAFVTIANRRSTPVTLSFPDPCVALLRVYEERGGRLAPVWDQATAADCTGEPVAMGLAPGAEHRVEIAPATMETILDGSVPPGRYRLTAYLRPESRIIEIEVGEVELTSR